MSMWSMTNEPVDALGSSPQTGHIGFYSGFIKKDDTFGILLRKLI